MKDFFTRPLGTYDPRDNRFNLFRKPFSLSGQFILRSISYILCTALLILYVMVATLLLRTCAGHLWIAIFLVLPGSMNSIEFLPLTILRLDSWVRNKAKPSHDLAHTRRTRVFPGCYHVIYE